MRILGNEWIGGSELNNKKFMREESNSRVGVYDRYKGWEVYE